MSIQLRGCAWGHARGYDPMVATASSYRALEPSVEVSWEQRSLQAFADQPMGELAAQYDLIVVDHPHVGEAAAEGFLVALDGLLPSEALAEQRRQSVGPSFASYQWAGHQWALPTDVAAQVAAWRPDLIDHPPRTWEEVVTLAEEGRVLWPLKPVDAVSSFFSLSANRGTPVATKQTELCTDQDAHAVLDQMLRVSTHVPAECLGLNPFEVLERLAADQDRYVYCPLLYGYSNYARPGYRPRLVRFANMPSLGTQGPKGSMLGGAGLAISASCRDVDAAAGYLLHVADAETQRTTYFEASGQPGNAVAWDDDGVNAASNDFFRDTRDTLEHSWVRPRYAGYLTVQEHVGQLVNHILQGTVDRESALREMDEVYLRTLAEAPSDGADPIEEHDR